jgi:Putative zinc-finger
MECEAVLLLLWEYLDEELRPEVAAAVAAHLRRCACCHPVYCCDRAFLRQLARQRDRCTAPAQLRITIRARLTLS